MKSYRLTENEKKIICEAFKLHFGEEDHLWLFGSRIDPQKRGGDIDLYIESMEEDADHIIDKKFDFINDLWLKLGEQKIDVVIRLIKQDFHLAIYDEAKKNGIKLI